LDWLFATTKYVTPKAHVIEKGYMVSKLWGNEGKHSGSHGRITAKGMEYLMNHFSKEA